MDRRTFALEELVDELRKCAGSDYEFAQIVALSCAAIADRVRHAEVDAGDAIRDYFEVSLL